MVVMMQKTSLTHSKFRDDLDRMKEVVDVRFLVESLGFEIIRDTSKELRGSCKIHGGDNKTSFRFNKETRTWICFSHNCQETYGNDIIGLIKGALNVEFNGAIEYLKSLVGDSFSHNLLEYERNKEREKFIKSIKPLTPSFTIVNEEKIRQYVSFRSDYFIKKGFSKDTLDNFEIGGGYVDSKGCIRETIPIRDDSGTLVAYSLRKVDDRDKDYKYLLTKGFDKDKVLYNLYNAKNYINNKPLIIVEGFKSVWKFYEYGINNVVAIMGSKITQGQANLIFTYASLSGVFLMFDGDMAGIGGTVKSYNLLRYKINKLYYTFIENNMSPDKLSKDSLYKYLNGFI